jgi:hypothetical protein
MKGITWSRDSHGLFDYESRHLTKRTMKTTQATQIIRKTNELELLGIEKEVHDETPSAETKQLLKIINEGGKCFTYDYHSLGQFILTSSLVNCQIKVTNVVYRCVFLGEFQSAQLLESGQPRNQ